jgi:hypothetical protein
MKRRIIPILRVVVFKFIRVFLQHQFKEFKYLLEAVGKFK